MTDAQHLLIFARRRLTLSVIGNLSAYNIIQYYFEGEPHDFQVKSYGNSKTLKPFYPTSESTKNRLKAASNCTSDGPSKIYDDKFKKSDDIM